MARTEQKARELCAALMRDIGLPHLAEQHAERSWRGWIKTAERALTEEAR